MAVVTISRQVGSKGDEIGQAVARELGATYLDKEIARLATERVGLLAADGEMEGPERDSRLARVIAVLTLADEFPPASGPVTPAGAAVRGVVEQIIREIAAGGHAVVVGRGSQVLLRDAPRTVHVHVRASLETRVARLAAQRGLSPTEAERVARGSDRERAAFVRDAYGVEWESADLYDLIVNTDRLSVEAAVAAIVAAARTVDAAATAGAERRYRRLRQHEYTVDEAADLLFMSPEVIRHAVYAGELPARRVGRDIGAIERRALLTWLERQPVMT